MKERKYIIPFNGEFLVFFFGEMDGEIVGIVTIIVRTPEYVPQTPAR